ncbi:cytochrome-c peroxidase [Ramlibacter albus]|uniref:C-type cytochrome n=1 Tax=Ramlibacter albus TaxID=2079448 RepID=A0A923S5H7_9BURK|nr:cytochrome c peroxidase [Ramlibacter albus]MBC5768634.1 c-type cytochrome [Ramlibacter albus]
MKTPIRQSAALALVATLAACGGGGDAAPTALAAAPAPAAATTANPATAPTTAPTTTTTTTTAIATATTTAAAPAAPTAGTTSPATPAPLALSAAAAAYLNLDIANLANYTPQLPAYYDAQVAGTDNTPPTNPSSNAVATLGRVLFHDKRLSINNTVACASCHQQALGFSDSKRFSTGFSGNAFTTAHSMRIGNVRYFDPGTMFWDRRAATLEAQATQPIQNAVEMGFDAANGGLPALFTKMRSLPYYAELFTLAFGDATINEDRVQRALAQFQRAMVSTNSRWDTGFAQVFNPAQQNRGLNNDLPNFTAQENRGRQIFMGNNTNCSACHVPPTFALAANSRSNGLDAGETTVFKSPSLKNVGLSSNFMHDGRFSSLEQVVEHYNSGVQDGPALDNRLRGPGGQPRRLNLTDADKAALVAFLRTLSDPVLTADPRFSDPFRQ